VACQVIKLKLKKKEYNDEVTKEGLATKVVWYLSIILRLKRLFENIDDTKKTFFLSSSNLHVGI